ncbi:hypothetical protein DYB32_001824 [Aphanomyces invadans]|uniref:MYND-type domain-containing protein n=1 Tax=Aphanomyces invadans TaxID=157072 RepID=A0A3R6Z8G7_9STRA|nr:hypothetical protein DYB32_001824 [Aphanomyces invadans]
MAYQVIRLLIASNDSPRDLTFSRTPPTLVRGHYDVGKVVQVEIAPGPLGLHLHQAIRHCAFVDEVLDTSPLKGLAHVVHRGCRLIRINKHEVSTMPREAVVALLAQLKDQTKTIEFYRMAPATCSALVQVDISEGDGLELDGLTVAAASSVNGLLVGDVVAAVNDEDITTLDAAAGLAVWNNAPFPKRVMCFRVNKMSDGGIPVHQPSLSVRPTMQPSPIHQASMPDPLSKIEVTIADAQLGLNVDTGELNYLRLTGFATPADAQRPYYQPHHDKLPGRCVASVNGIDASSFSRHAVLELLGKLALVPKTIVFVTSADLAKMRAKALRVTVEVPPGSLGVDFDGNITSSTVLTAFRPVDGAPGALERSGVVDSGSILVAINQMNVSSLALHQTIDLLKKLTDIPKQLTFVRGGVVHAVTQPFVDVSVPPGPIGVALNSAIATSTIVQAVTPGSAVEAMGVIGPGSILVAIDGFDVTALSLAKSTELLRALSGHRKILSFTTLSNKGFVWPASFVMVPTSPGPLGLQFDSGTPDAAVVQGFVQLETAASGGVGDVQKHGGVAIGSSLVGIDGVDVRSKSLMEISAILKDMGKVAKILCFSPPSDKAISPPSTPKAFPPTTPFPRQNSLETLQKQINLSDDQVEMLLQRRKSDMSDKPPMLKPQVLVVDKDQKSLNVHDWDGKLKSMGFSRLAIASITGVTKGKGGFSKKHSWPNIDDNLCLSIAAGKSASHEYITTSMEDRDVLAGLVEALMRTTSAQPRHQTPTLLLVLSPISIILKVEPIIHSGPVVASDFAVLQSSLAPNSRVFCPLKYEALLCEGLGAAAGSLNLTIVGRPDSEIPLAFAEIADQFATNIPSRCALCDNTEVNVAFDGYAARPCVCAGMEAIPGVTDAILHSVFDTSSRFWAATPWLHMRINHVLRVEVAGSPFRFVQILGGTGCCDVAVMVHTQWDDVQNENWSVSTMHMNTKGCYSVVKAEFQPPGQGCRSWKDLDYIDAQARLGRPLALPDPANPDPVTQPVLPLFTRISIKRKSGTTDLDVRQVSATLEEITYLQVAMWAVVTLLNDQLLQAVPHSPVGDYRKFYALQMKLPIPDNLVVHGSLPPHQRHVFVQFPAVNDVSALSELQAVGVELAQKQPDGKAKKKKKKKKKEASPGSATPSSSMEHDDDDGIVSRPHSDNDSMEVAALARMRDIMTKKAFANAFYQKGQYLEAYAHYTLVLDEYQRFRASLAPHHQMDPQLVLNGDNLYSNRAQAALKLEWYDKTVEDCNHVIPFMVSQCSNTYVARCLHARARAYAALHLYDSSFDDWHVLAIEAQKHGSAKAGRSWCDVPPKTYLADEGQKIQKKLAACTVDGQWRIMGTSGTHLTRFFHSTVLHPDGTSLVVFGGRSTTIFGNEDNDTNVHLYEFKSQSWKDIVGTGDVPPCLAGHSAVVYDRSMYVFGGSPLKDDGQHDSHGAFYLLNLDTFVWKRWRLPNEPAPRNEHTASLHKHLMILYGGVTAPSTTSSHIDVFNFKTKKWSVLPQRMTEYAPPPSLSLHTAWIHNAKLYVFGGKADTADFYEYQNKLYTFDLASHSWMGSPPPMGPSTHAASSAFPPIYPGPRSESHAIVIENTMYQFGGYAELPVGSKYYGDGYRLTHYADNSVSWAKFNASSMAMPWPSSRAACTLTLDPQRKRAILYGGYETMRNDIVYGDIWELNLADQAAVASFATLSPPTASTLTVCGSCGVEGKWKKCARCNAKAYCSQACQKKDWPTHKATCRSPRT